MSDPESPTSRPKRIIICCDGTWQSATSGKKNVPSNVTRLARELDRVGVDADGKEWQQVVWYDSGVGTTSLLGREAEGATGSGLENKVIDAYHFVALNWVPGDKVYCFGFSRGAFTARSIAGLISDIGICEPRMLQHFSELWGLYKANKEDRFYGSAAYWDFMNGTLEEPLPEDPGYKGCNLKWKDKPKGDWASTCESREMEMVGVYDTVRALGIVNEHNAFEAAFDMWHSVSTDRKKSVEEKRQIKQKYDAARQTIEKLEAEAIMAQKDTVDKCSNDWQCLRFDPNVPLQDREAVHQKYNNAQTKLVQMEEHHKPPPELSQVWFPGVHINVGGGSSDTLDYQGDMEGMPKSSSSAIGLWDVLSRLLNELTTELADIAFSWMLDQIRPHLSISSTVYEQYCIERSMHLAELNEEAKQEQERLQKESDEQKNESYWKTGYRWVRTSAQTIVQSAVENYNSYVHKIEKKNPKNQKFFDFGWGTGTVIDSYTWTYVANGCLARTPHGYDQTTRGRTHESVHPVVGYRMYSSRKKYKDSVIAARNAEKQDEKKKLEEECKALKKLIYNPIGMKSGDQPVAIRRKKESGGWEYEFHGNGKPLPEWKLRPSEMSDVLFYEGMTSIPEDDALWYAVNAPSYERRALHSDFEAEDYLHKLDEINGYKSSWPLPDVANTDLDAWFTRGEIPTA
ncbi:hypothetical protein SLS64_012276 [Diaporthe eres]